MKVMAAILPATRGEKAAGLLCVITYHHKTVVELGENGLNPLSELLYAHAGDRKFF